MLCELADCLATGPHIHVIPVPKGRTVAEVWHDLRLFGCLPDVTAVPLDRLGSRSDEDGMWALVGVGGFDLDAQDIHHRS